MKKIAKTVCEYTVGIGVRTADKKVIEESAGHLLNVPTKKEAAALIKNEGRVVYVHILDSKPVRYEMDIYKFVENAMKVEE